MKFIKVQGLGNDFILLDDRDNICAGLDLVSFAKKYCDRHTGIGADGVLVVSPSPKANANMRLINADGSEAEMCGNGIRCVAKYLIDKNIATSPVKIETLAGIMTVEQVNDAYKVDMGVPKITNTSEISGGGTQYTATLVNVGNPHCVIFVDDFDFDWKAIGEDLEHNKMFPNRTNVEFVRVVSPTALEANIWERGAGATLACGTGACASLVAAVAAGKSERKAIVTLPGGNLEVELTANHVYMTGPAERVFEGEIML
jgi:diaminopimelate epimerase